MNKIILLLLLCFPFLSHARVTLLKTDKLDRLAIQKLHKAQVQFLIDWEKKNSVLPKREKNHDVYSLIERVRDYVIADAYAQDATTMCIFGGWISKKSSRGSCELPWNNRQFATSRGVTGYGPKCGGSLFRCNPALFGGANAPCVQPTADYSGLTAACNQQAGNWLERLSDTEFEQWKQSSFTPMQAQIAQFCSGSANPYNDGTCTTLNQMIATVTAESARRTAVAPTPEVAPVPTPEVAPVPTPEVAPVPTPEVAPTPIPSLTSEAVTVTAIPTPEVAPTPTPEVAPTPVTVSETPRTGRLFSMSIVGGSGDDEFFDEGGQAFNRALASLNSNGDVYYGGRERNGQCYSVFRQQIELNGRTVPVTALRENFNPQTCEGTGDVVQAMSGLSDIQEKTCPPGPRSVAPGVLPKGPASASGRLALASTSDLQSGDTFYLNITDHGMLENGRWSIGLSDGSKIYADDLKNRIRTLAQRGVNVQLSADACFSGGFSKEMMNLQNELIESGTSHGMVCATSSQDPNLVGYGSDAILKAGYSENYFPALQRYQNQLSAAACAAGSDMINRPTSSLLEYVKSYNQGKNNQGTTSVSADCDLQEFDNSLGQELQRLQENMAQISLRAQREALLSDFRELYLNPLKQCWQENQADVRYARSLATCLERPTNPPIPEELVTYIKDAFGDLTASRQEYEDVLNYTRFLGDPNVTENDLNRFKADFCCLARNLRTGALPVSCR